MSLKLTFGAKPPLAIPLLTGVEATHVIADKGYDSDKILGFIRWQGAIAVIPPKSERSFGSTTGNCTMR